VSTSGQPPKAEAIYQTWYPNGTKLAISRTPVGCSFVALLVQDVINTSDGSHADSPIRYGYGHISERVELISVNHRQEEEQQEEEECK
jgi:hypothetical protein